MSGDLVQNLKRAGEQVLGAKGLTGNDHVRLSALLKVAALEVEALRAAEGVARDDAAELRAAAQGHLEALDAWLKASGAEGNPIRHAAQVDFNASILALRAALAATEGSAD